MTEAALTLYILRPDADEGHWRAPPGPTSNRAAALAHDSAGTTATSSLSRMSSSALRT
jgi:hypothetical protein